MITKKRGGIFVITKRGRGFYARFSVCDHTFKKLHIIQGFYVYIEDVSVRKTLYFNDLEAIQIANRRKSIIKRRLTPLRGP